MEEIEDDKKDSFKNKFEHEVITYQDEITLLKMKMKEFNTLKLQHEESMKKNRHYMIWDLKMQTLNLQMK